VYLLKGEISKQKLDGERNASLLSQKRSRKPSFNVVKAAAPKRNRRTAHRFRAGQRSWPCCAQAHSENRRQAGENEQAHFSGLPPVFFCPEALWTTFKLQAQIVCHCVQAGSPAGFFAAFFPGKKARTLSPSDFCLFL